MLLKWKIKHQCFLAIMSSGLYLFYLIEYLAIYLKPQTPTGLILKCGGIKTHPWSHPILQSHMDLHLVGGVLVV